MLAPLSLIVVLAAVAAAGDAAIAEAKPGKRQGLTFQDVRPLKLEWKAATAGVLVKVCNLDRKPAKNVTAALTGFHGTGNAESVGGDEVWEDPEQTDDQATGVGKPPDYITTIGSGACQDLRVKAKGTTPPEDTYEGILVVTSGGSGGARRKVVLTVPKQGKEEQGVSGEPKGPRLMPDSVSDFSVGGINFWPSVLNPLGLASLTTGILLAFLLVPLCFIPNKPKKAKRVLIALGVLILGLIGYGGVNSLCDGDTGLFDSDGPSEVVMRKQPVGDGAQTGTVGTLVGKDGSLASAVVVTDDKGGTLDELEAQDIQRAGAYTGKVDLLPDNKDAGAATMTANVRDFWPWAFAVIALGVGVGALLSWYFTIKRGRDRVRVTVADLRVEMRDESPLPFAAYSVAEGMEERLSEVDELLKRDPPDTKKAEEQVTAATTFFRDATALWDMLPVLDDTARFVAGLAIRMGLVADGDSVPAVSQARDLLLERLDSRRPDADKRLSTRREEVYTAQRLLDDLARLLPRAKSMKDAAAATHTTGWPPEAVAALTTKRAALATATENLRDAVKPDDARTAWSNVLLAHEAIVALVKANPSPPADEALYATWEPDAYDLEVSLAAVGSIDGRRARKHANGLRRRFKRTDIGVTILSAWLAVLSGLAALYIPSSTWGSPGDYLQALLWGSVVSEGVKYAAALVARTAPPGA